MTITPANAQRARSGTCAPAVAWAPAWNMPARANNGAGGTAHALRLHSDGSGLPSNGTLDNSIDGRGEGVWTGDNSSTAASFFMVYNPGGRPQLFSGDGLAPEVHQQIGHFRGDGSVETSGTPAANAVNLLAETVILNYMALHGEQGLFSAANFFPNHGLGSVALRDSLTAFDPIVSGTI